MSDGSKTPPGKLRFNYLTMRSGAGEFDDLSHELPVMLTRCIVRWWEQAPKNLLPDRDDDPITGALFPAFIAEYLHKKERGYRIERLNVDLGLELCFPLDASYYVYYFDDRVNDADITLSGGKDADGKDSQENVAKRLENVTNRAFPLGTRLIGQQYSAFGGQAQDDQQIPAELENLEQDKAEKLPLIYLFNVIVALEWEPDLEDQEQLSWAFHRASEFLYDISDGTLAFGQVVFGTSPALVQAADIVIAASTRLQGRSWRGGMHHPNKRMPIRLGRSEWRHGIAIPWDEPEGYRVMVHEWGHYALHLTDAYLHEMSIKEVDKRVGDAVTLKVFEIVPNSCQESRYILAPNPFLSGLTVMETLDGTSEISPRREHDGLGKPQASEYDLIHKLYPSEKTKIQNRRPLSGPRRIPMGIPYIFFENPNSSSPSFLFNASKYFDKLRIRKPHDIPKRYGYTLYTSCWLYVLSPQSTPLGERKLVAQGTLELRSAVQPFKLINAAKGDLLIAIVDSLDGKPRVYRSSIDDLSNTNASPDDVWIEMFSGGDLPQIVVQPKKMESTYVITAEEREQLPKIFVSVQVIGGRPDYQPSAIWLCPLLGAVQVVEPGQEVQIHSLDGHVVAWFPDGPMVYCFSHGGNPPNHTTGRKSQLPSGGAPHAHVTVGGEAQAAGAPDPLPPLHAASGGPAPAVEQPAADAPGTSCAATGSAEIASRIVSYPSITAGSSDGYIRIYFDNTDREYILYEYDHIRFVTTVQNDLNHYGAPQGAKYALSYPFSLSCSLDKVPDHLHMTLEVRYNNPARFEMVDGYVMLCILQAGRWVPQPTCQFTPLGSLAVATELSASGTPDLAFFRGASERYEQYQLWWFPLAAQDRGGQAA